MPRSTIQFFCVSVSVGLIACFAAGCGSDGARSFGEGGNGGGQSATGGRVGNDGGTGATPGSGGGQVMGTGGVSNSGGAVGTGGVGHTGGSGGRAASGGTGGNSTGGAAGGMKGTGGVSGSGGRVATGGTTGSGGVIGTGGTGGVDSAKCDQLASDYQKEMPDARSCTVGAAAQCQVLVSGSLTCGCNTYVQDAAKLNDIRDSWNAAGCGSIPRACPALACILATKGNCVAQPSGTPQCVNGSVATTQ